jgi:hypothetical protein
MPRITASDGIDLIASTGLPVEVKTFTDVKIAERNARLFVRQTPPSPSSFSADSRIEGIRLYVVPRLTDSLRALAEDDHRIAVAAVNDGIVIFDGEQHRALSAQVETRSEKLGRRVAWGRYAVLRALARTRLPRTQAQLAHEAGVTQAAISQSLKRLDPLVLRTADGWSARDFRAIAETFLAEYPGARGITTRWFSLEPVTRQAESALGGGDTGVLLSGDAGADKIAPWRTPVRAVLYGRTGLNLAPHGFAESDADHTSLEYIVPADHTIWTTAAGYAQDHRPVTADPLICAHDILRIGGPDSDEAAEHVIRQLEREWEGRER